ncbi:hypothetical protein F0562_014129 [Nyssa sinensis]|uniref:Uncharacterized protein n=1 Tax=Nyssa sinensis TaxID=561372 RepID=A0A5J4ZRS5_9ASTE|nr:hypothetical protein F0562_014129 [Nyssa sinensis]
MDNKQPGGEDLSSAEAVLLGALAPGVNGPTWNTLKIAFLFLGLCLAAMLGLAFSSSDSALIIHVTFLVLISGTLFLLLSGYGKSFCNSQILGLFVYTDQIEDGCRCYVDMYPYPFIWAVVSILICTCLHMHLYVYV